MAVGASVRIGFIDNKGKESFTKVQLPVGFSIPDYLDAGLQLAQLMTDISLAQVVSVGVCVTLDLASATIKAAAQLFSDVAEKFYFQFRSSVGNLIKRVKIPAINETTVLPNSDVVDTANPDISAYITAMESGLTTTGGIIQPTDRRGNDLEALEVAYEQFRKT